MQFLTVGIGFFVACAVAATGIGGGVLLMPLLILVLRIAPTVAVGTALSFMSVTKLLAVLLHWRQKTLDLLLVGYLALGSVPGAIAGTAGLAFLHSRFGEDLNTFLRVTIAGSLITIAFFSFILETSKLQSWSVRNSRQRSSSSEPTSAICIGFAGGLLVSMTSVGSGSLIILLLLVFCPRSSAVLVGTDIFHGMALTIVAAFLHLRLNSVNLHILGWLLLGSVVGVIIGTRISALLAPELLRKCLLVLAMFGGLAMLWPN